MFEDGELAEKLARIADKAKDDCANVMYVPLPVAMADQIIAALRPTASQPAPEVVGQVRREIAERTRNVMAMLAELREAVDLDDESSGPVLSGCDDIETAIHNIAAVASHLPPESPKDDADARALNGYRAAVSYISADSWDGCSDCIEILRAARTADVGWDWAGDTNRIAAELKAIRPFCNRDVHEAPKPASEGALREAEARAEITRLTAEAERLREALTAIATEAEREGGRWNHLKRVIGLQARAALAGGEAK